MGAARGTRFAAAAVAFCAVWGLGSVACSKLLGDLPPPVAEEGGVDATTGGDVVVPQVDSPSGRDASDAGAETGHPGGEGGCIPDPPSTTCLGRSCGAATNNCGQTVGCGDAGSTACGASGDVCLEAGTCCAPDNATACAGKCNTPATNNCGQTITCPSTCADGGVCLSNGCCAPDPNWCQNRCGTSTDNCGRTVSCGGCAGGLTCSDAGACGCVPDPIATTCAGQTCGSAVNNCGQTVSCGSGGTTNCSSSSQVCVDGGSCCTPDNVTPCNGLCNTTVTNNCGQTITCPAACPNGGVCTSANQCCTPNNSACNGLQCGTTTDNCGQTISCGSCTPGAADECTNGQCTCEGTPPCASGDTCCSGYGCSTLNDNSNCGACGNACAGRCCAAYVYNGMQCPAYCTCKTCSCFTGACSGGG